mmetsp:Transcript_9685/g.30139  ORF Transcript_9685/g.30139 Transcript_9685/m.30139 type:complete len:316 (-) Transcript_9685:51-998(-)
MQPESVVVRSGTQAEAGPGVQAVVKNTFIHAVDLSEQANKQALRRSASDSDISHSSGKPEGTTKFWFGKERSSSRSSSEQSTPNPSGANEYGRNDSETSSSHAASSQSTSHPAGPQRVGATQPQLPPDVVARCDELVLQLHGELGVPVEDLIALDAQGLLRQIPRNAEGEMTSVGSVLHATGECSPCVFWFKNSCSKSIKCSYCHFMHRGQKNKRIRPSKQTRMQMKGRERECLDAHGGATAGNEDPCYAEAGALSGPLQQEHGAPPGPLDWRPLAALGSASLQADSHSVQDSRSRHQQPRSRRQGHTSWHKVSL